MIHSFRSTGYLFAGGKKRKFVQNIFEATPECMLKSHKPFAPICLEHETTLSILEHKR